MVRTAATAVRASGGKSSKAVKSSTTPSNPHGSSSSSDKHTIGGNPIHPRETPSWQKPITNFFTKSIENDTSRNIEQSDNTEEIEEFLGEGSSLMHNVERMEIEEHSNKENNTPQSKIEDDTMEIMTDNNTKVPRKEQKVDFYKHLEEIERNLI